MNEYIKSKWTYALIVLTVFAMIIWIVAGTSHDNKENNITPKKALISLCFINLTILP